MNLIVNYLARQGVTKYLIPPNDTIIVNFVFFPFVLILARCHLDVSPSFKRDYHHSLVRVKNLSGYRTHESFFSIFCLRYFCRSTIYKRDFFLYLILFFFNYYFFFVKLDVKFFHRNLQSGMAHPGWVISGHLRDLGWISKY